MTTSRELHKRQPTAALGQLTFWLSRSVPEDGASDWIVDTIYARTPKFVQTLVFSDKSSGKSLIATQLWGVFRTCLQKFDTLEEDTGTFNDTEFEFDLPGLYLKGLQVVYVRHPGQVSRIMVSFNQGFGTIAQIFAPGQVPSPFETAQNDIATRILEDLIRPTLDLCNLPQDALRLASTDTLERRLEALMGKRDDLDFYATLLTRFVAQQAEIGINNERGWQEPANVPETPGLPTSRTR